MIAELGGDRLSMYNPNRTVLTCELFPNTLKKNIKSRRPEAYLVYTHMNFGRKTLDSEGEKRNQESKKNRRECSIPVPVV